MFRRFCLFLLVSLAGCNLLAPIGPIVNIGVHWIEGEAHKYYNSNQQTLHAAVKGALVELDLPITSEWKDGNTIHVRAGDDDRFKIKVIAVRENITKVSIRVNFFGDKPYAELIYRHVEKQPGVEQFLTVDALNTAMHEQPRPEF